MTSSLQNSLVVVICRRRKKKDLKKYTKGYNTFNRNKKRKTHSTKSLTIKCTHGVCNVVLYINLQYTKWWKC